MKSWCRHLPWILICAVAARAAAADSVEVAFAGGKQNIAAYRQERVTFISFSELADLLGGTLDWETVGHEIRYTDGANRFDFVLHSPFFKLNEHIYNMTFPADLRNGQLFVPAETFVGFLNGVLPQSITFNTDLSLLRIDSEYFNVTDLSVSGKANGLLIEIMLTGAMPYDVFLTEGNWVNVSITGGRINQSQILSRKDSRYMYKVSTHQAAGSGQVSLHLKGKVENFHHKMAYNPPRIQISIADASFSLDSSETTPVVGPDDKIDVIVIDPGHGGSDYGAIGRGGTREKDVVLEIARDLAKLIRKDKQFRVVMTRDGDKTVTLDQRADKANKEGADLFISIHANASVKQRARGWNVFFLAPAKNDSARAVAQFENSFFLKEQSALDLHRGDTASDMEEQGLDNPILSILNEMIMTEFQSESYDFAMMLAREFRSSLKVPSRGVDQAGFFVLNKVYTPSVLIETGFISNKSEEKTLKSGRYQKQVAKAIYEAIKKFKAKFEADRQDRAG